MFIHVDPNSKLAKVILVLGIPFWVTMLWFVMGEIELSFQSTKWPVANGTILKSQVETHTDVHGIPHSTAKIEYAYQVNGRRFENENWLSIRSWPFDRASAEKEAAAWPPGNPPQCITIRFTRPFPAWSPAERLDKWHVSLLASFGLVIGTRTATVALGRFGRNDERPIRISR